jgi:putative ABC transport system permease protein
MKRTLFNFVLAIEGVLANKVRAALTALGIIFGVGAVIAMLAIGTGAKQSILEQMKLIGTNNIVINPVTQSQQEEAEESSETQTDDNSNKLLWTPGLTLKDMKAIQMVLPGVESVSPELVMKTNIVQSGKTQKAKCIGVTNAFFQQNNLSLDRGHLFHFKHLEGSKPVCIIGYNIKNKFFADQNPLGQSIKAGTVWFKIIGVLQQRTASKESLETLGIRDYNSDIYIPVTTALLRFDDRAKFTEEDIGRRRTNSSVDNYHQLDKLVVRVADAGQLRASADVIARLLKRRHRDMVDFEVEVPELLLQQQQKTQDTFNFVLAVIAGISLLVGGIGIMNIMLASVLERIKEIGIRRSLGATQTDITLQFLFEAIFISLLGGIIGVVLGIAAAHTIASSADIPTVVTAWSILLSFGVAAIVGLVFGLFPAQKAAKEDPIKALRTD